MSLPIQKAVFNLVTTVLLMGGYVYYVFSIKGNENLPLLEDLQFWGKFMLIMFAVMMAGKIVLYIIFGIFRKARYNDEDDFDFMDERDKLIEMKSERNGNYLFFVGLMGAMIPIALGHPVQYLFIILISSGFVSGILSDIWKIYYYNRGV